jgi:hypothetical protein
VEQEDRLTSVPDRQHGMRARPFHRQIGGQIVGQHGIVHCGYQVQSKFLRQDL